MARSSAFTPLRSRSRLAVRIAAGIIALLLIAIVILYAVAGFFDRDPVRLFAADKPNGAYAAVYFSGDMGLRFGMGSYTGTALAAHSIPVFGVNSSTAFATRRSREQLDAIVAQSARDALMRTGAHHLILIGQSFGADILQTGLARLPTDLRAKIAAVILVVPGQTVYFRADPSNLYYRGQPDSQGSATAPGIDWTPLTCIYGALETDSLCPTIRQHNATVIRLPGGHFLRNDHALLIRMVLAAIGSAAPGALAHHE